MKIIRAKDYKDMSRKAANIISAQVIMKPNCVLGLATGRRCCDRILNRNFMQETG